MSISDPVVVMVITSIIMEPLTEKRGEIDTNNSKWIPEEREREDQNGRERESNDHNNGCLAMLLTQSQDVVSWTALIELVMCVSMKNTCG